MRRDERVERRSDTEAVDVDEGGSGTFDGDGAGCVGCLPFCLLYIVSLSMTDRSNTLFFAIFPVLSTEMSSLRRSSIFAFHLAESAPMFWFSYVK